MSSDRDTVPLIDPWNRFKISFTTSTLNSPKARCLSFLQNKEVGRWLGKKLIAPFPKGEPVKPAYSAIHILSALHLIASPQCCGYSINLRDIVQKKEHRISDKELLYSKFFHSHAPLSPSSACLLAFTIFYKAWFGLVSWENGFR